MTFEVLAGDCREVMATLEADSVDAIVTDPPYELGFMGKSWDASGIAYDLDVWRQALRVLKPGGHLLAFSGSRTYHRMVCAIEDAGFEIRDQIMWLYGSGFPKSHDVSKAIDREAGAERQVVGKRRQRASGPNSIIPLNASSGEFELITAPATPEAERWSGWGTALKPAHEPIVVARKPFKGTVAQNVLAHGTGALNIDGCRVGTEGGTRKEGDQKFGWNGSRSGARVMVTGIDAGRWPANVIHDGSDEVLRLFPETTSGSRAAGVRKGMGFHGVDGDGGPAIQGSSGSAARFFYCAKASKRDREEGLDGFEERRVFGDGGASLDGISNTRGPRANHHPTVKPTDLMRYLCRLVTPPGGIVLDPFTGSGSTGKAAVLEGFRFLGIEMDAGYREIAKARITFCEDRRPNGSS